MADLNALGELLPQAMTLLAAQPGMAPAADAPVALPMRGRRTVIAALRNRPNWYEVPRMDLDALARLMCERNWFARPVTRARVAVYGAGFRMRDDAAQAWAAAGSYPFARIQRDMIEEWVVSGSIVAWWKRAPGEGVFPVIHVPSSGDVEFDDVGGAGQVSIRFRRRKLKEEDKVKYGERLWDAIMRGKRLVITEDDPEFQFSVMREGKSTDPLPVPPITGILDDLDFVEAVRVGDWNGAKARWEVVRHTKKGFNITSGNNAGSGRGHAKPEELSAIVKQMKAILGKVDMATNFDQEIDWLTFPKDHFHPELLREVKQRLLFWSGAFGILLLQSESQGSGVLSSVVDSMRAEVLGFRAEFRDFLSGIWASGSFRAGIPGAPELVPDWSVQPLYSAKGFLEYVNSVATNAIAAPQTVRGLLGFDNERESELMQEAHENAKAYTPPFEPRQGIASAMTVPDDPGGNQKQLSEPRPPGRPSET